MLQRCLLFHAVAKQPPKQRYEDVMSLPLDVVLRRMQSSSATNHARGLEAHFRAAKDERDGGGNITEQCAALSSAPAVDIRSALAQKLLLSLGEGSTSKSSRGTPLSSVSSSPFTAAFHKTAAAGRSGLSLDEVSLVLANALRHGLSEHVVRASFAAFSDRMDDRHRGGAGGSGGFFFSAACDVAVLKAEALSRVLEACVAASESITGGSGLNGLTRDMWASLTGWLVERWDLLEGSPSTACLMLQFYALVIERVDRGAAATEEGRLSFTSLQTDPALLKEHCYRQCGKALDGVLSDYFPLKAGDNGGQGSPGIEKKPVSVTPAPAKVLSRPTELVRLSHAVFRLQAYERQVRAATHVNNSSSAPIAAAATSSSVAWRRWWQSGRRRREQKNALLNAPLLSLSNQLGTVVAEHAVPASRSRPSAVSGYSAGGNGSSSLNSGRVLSVSQAATVFSAVAESVPTTTTGDIAFVLSEMLRQKREDGSVSADAETMASVLAIGETCLRRSDGTLTVLAEVLKCLQTSAFVLAQLAFDGRLDGGAAMPHAAAGGTESSHISPQTPYTLWPKACELVENAPFSLQSTADQTQRALAVALLSQPMPHPGRTQQQPGTSQLRYGRYGALVLAWQLTHSTSSSDSSKHTLTRAVTERVCELAESFPFVDEQSHEERKVDLRAVIRALSVFTSRPVGSMRAPWQHRHVRLVKVLLQQLSLLLVTEADAVTGKASRSSAQNVGLEALTATERTMLREVVRAVRSQTALTSQLTRPDAVKAQRSVETLQPSQASDSFLKAASRGKQVVRQPTEEGGQFARWGAARGAMNAQPLLEPSCVTRSEPVLPTAATDLWEDSYQLQKELTLLSHELQRRFAVK